jgi:hypothetical protein
LPPCFERLRSRRNTNASPVPEKPGSEVLSKLGFGLVLK